MPPLHGCLFVKEATLGIMLLGDETLSSRGPDETLSSMGPDETLSCMGS